MPLQKILPTILHNGFAFCEKGTVLILKNNTVEAIVAKEDAGDDVQMIDGIVCPGFVNTHCHLELSYLKNKIPPMTGMVDFLIAVMENRNTDEKTIHSAIANAENEMLQNGIVAVGDICNTTNTIIQKQQNNLYYKNFIEISGFVPATATQRLDAGNQVLQAFAAAQLNATIVPHAPYSVSEKLFELIYSNHPLPSSIHYKESKAELEWMQNAKGDMQKLYNKFGIDTTYFNGNNNQKYAHNSTQQIWVHSVYLNKEDFTLLHDDNSKYVCLCPNANLFIGNDLPDVNALLQFENQICIGTDSYASNNSLNIIDELKTLKHYFPNITLETMLRWATSNGAAALGMAHQLGSFEKGKLGKYVVLNDF